ncbi:MAG: hypothetical protein HY749_06290 [Gammaproteobacteria bacterium]|nr:hypothetical protein [Gammaproteobacteria bacterium]MBI5618646.1 hypothetical protein [Gammaproteobacteria bacterium]
MRRPDVEARNPRPGAVAALLLCAPGAAHAVCPVCTVAVGFGVGLSRWLGIDDLISGLWIGGLVVSLVIWTLSWLDTRGIGFPARGAIVTVAYFLVVVAPLQLAGITGHPFNTLWGVDRLLLGVALGSAAFWAGARLYARRKARHGGHAAFPFQKVAMPIAPLVVLSIAFYFILK